MVNQFEMDDKPFFANFDRDKFIEKMNQNYTQQKGKTITQLKKMIAETEAKLPELIEQERKRLAEKDALLGHIRPEPKPEHLSVAKQVPNWNYKVCPDGTVYMCPESAEPYVAKLERQCRGFVVKMIDDNSTRSYGKYRKPTSVALLVAEAFLPNPEGKKKVIFKSGDKYDHRVENLEWAD